MNKLAEEFMEELKDLHDSYDYDMMPECTPNVVADIDSLLAADEEQYTIEVHEVNGKKLVTMLMEDYFELRDAILYVNRIIDDCAEEEELLEHCSHTSTKDVN